MTSSLHKSKQTNMESSTGTAVAHSPNLYLKVVVGWYEGGKSDANSQYINKVFPYFMFNPLSISSTVKSFTEL